jgi:hypothetical protein
MKARLQNLITLSTTLLVSGLNFAYAQDQNSRTEIEAVILQYFKGMANRDVESLRGVLDKKLMVVEAGHTSAKTGVVDTSKNSELLPPEGNDDWTTVKVSAIETRVSGTHRSVAVASFILTQPLDDKKIAALQAVLKDRPEALDEAQRKEVTKRIADRAIQHSELAMLARRDGKWKIVSISVPD